MSTTTRSDQSSRSLEAAAWALVIFQVVHGLTPADTESEGYVGAVVGLILLSSACTAVYGARAQRHWAPAVTAWTGLTVAVGFILYHASPVRSPITNPYPGEPVGTAAWISVALAVAAGFWAAYEGFTRTANS
jgi:drug/metabolite transporter (DMT)-like permease